MRVIAIALTLFGCSSTAATTAPELIGKWQAAGPIGESDAPGPSWMKEYDLRSDGTFEMTGYPPILVSGRWKVAERDGSRFRIVLTEQTMKTSKRDKGSAWADQDQWATLEGARLKWQDATFTRSNPKQ